MYKSVISTFLFLLFAHASNAVLVYENTFDSSSSIDGFTKFGESFVAYSPPPLHTVAVESGQLKIETDYYQPNGASSPPTLLGRATLILSNTSFGNGFSSILSHSTGLISWAFNLSNQSGRFNNGFHVILASTKENPYDIEAQGYYFRGGSMVGDRMGIWRFDHGIGGGQEVLVDIPDGLGVSPETGSLKVTYNPFNNNWTLLGEISDTFVNPRLVDTKLGSATDGTYTQLSTPYLGLGGKNTGVNTFDNLSVSVPDAINTGTALTLVLLLAFTCSRSIRKRAKT
ncbi:hypothetical protein VDG1235_4751 [Verrucomicrobiia bacterium DG1235]|nr:hypothetical protein VDG1235_4751 [Verrucomicrobiae bacterium DG1235]